MYQTKLEEREREREEYFSRMDDKFGKVNCTFLKDSKI